MVVDRPPKARFLRSGAVPNPRIGLEPPLLQPRRTFVTDLAVRDSPSSPCRMWCCFPQEVLPLHIFRAATDDAEPVLENRSAFGWCAWDP